MNATASCEGFKARRVVAHESFSFCSGPPFDLEFTSNGGLLGGGRFTIDQNDRPATRGPRRAMPFVMLVDSGWKVGTMTYVIALIGAAKDVDVEFRGHLHRSPSTREYARSGHSTRCSISLGLTAS